MEKTNIGLKLYILNKYAKKCRDSINTLKSFLKWYTEKYNYRSKNFFILYKSYYQYSKIKTDFWDEDKLTDICMLFNELSVVEDLIHISRINNKVNNLFVLSKDSPDYQVLIDDLYECYAELKQFKENIYNLKDRVISAYELYPIGFHYIGSYEEPFLLYDLDGFQFHLPTALQGYNLKEKFHLEKLENLQGEISSKFAKTVCCGFTEALNLFQNVKFKHLNERYCDKWKIGFIYLLNDYKEYEYVI